MVESLERRQLLSLVVDVKAASDTSTMLTRVGQVVNFDVWATATGADATITNDGVQTLFGSFYSTNVGGGAALGTLKATVVAPFDGSASTGGEQLDLDGDGDLDVGVAPNSTVTGGVFVARANTMTTTGGVAVSKGQSFKVATLTFTVTKLLSGNGAYTTIKFVPRVSGNPVSVNAVWQEDGVRKVEGGTSTNGIFMGGAGVTLRRNIGSITGKVFNDKNSNGERETTESGLGAWKLYIDSNKNKKLDAGELSVTTSSGGMYTFGNLKAGTYRIRIVQQAGWRKTRPLGSFYDVVLDPGLAITGRNWGETTNVLITGSVFNDANGNRIKDTGEGVRAGWRVFVDRNGDGVYSKTSDVGVLTDAAGNFTISSLPAGTYKIRAATFTGYVATTPLGGVYTMVLASGQATSPLVFGVRQIT